MRILSLLLMLFPFVAQAQGLRLEIKASNKEYDFGSKPSVSIQWVNNDSEQAFVLLRPVDAMLPFIGRPVYRAHLNATEADYMKSEESGGCFLCNDLSDQDFIYLPPQTALTLLRNQSWPIWPWEMPEKYWLGVGTYRLKLSYSMKKLGAPLNAYRNISEFLLDQVLEEEIESNEIEFKVKSTTNSNLQRLMKNFATLSVGDTSDMVVKKLGRRPNFVSYLRPTNEAEQVIWTYYEDNENIRFVINISQANQQVLKLSHEMR